MGNDSCYCGRWAHSVANESTFDIHRSAAPIIKTFIGLLFQNNIGHLLFAHICESTLDINPLDETETTRPAWLSHTAVHVTVLHDQNILIKPQQSSGRPEQQRVSCCTRNMLLKLAGDVPHVTLYGSLQLTPWLHCSFCCLFPVHNFGD